MNRTCFNLHVQPTFLPLRTPVAATCFCVSLDTCSERALSAATCAKAPAVSFGALLPEHRARISRTSRQIEPDAAKLRGTPWKYLRIGVRRPESEASATLRIVTHNGEPCSASGLDVTCALAISLELRAQPARAERGPTSATRPAPRSCADAGLTGATPPRAARLSQGTQVSAGSSRLAVCFHDVAVVFIVGFVLNIVSLLLIRTFPSSDVHLCPRPLSITHPWAKLPTRRHKGPQPQIANEFAH